MVGKHKMKWQEIIYLIEDDVDENLKRDLSTIFGMLKVKNIESIPIDKLLKYISYGDTPVMVDDEETKSKIIDVITTMNNVVDKVENNIVYFVGNKSADYNPSTSKEKDDKKEVKTDATKQAKKNLKDKK